MSLAREDELHKLVLKKDKEIAKLLGELKVEQEKTRKVQELVEKYESVITDLYGKNTELQAWFDEMVQTVDILRNRV